MSSFTEAQIVALPRVKGQPQEYEAADFFYWELGAPGSGRIIYIPKGRRTDGPTVYKWLKWLFGWFIDMQSLMKSSFIHDEMLSRPEEFTKLEAHAAFLMCMEADKVRPSLMWAAFLAVAFGNR